MSEMSLQERLLRHEDEKECLRGIITEFCQKCSQMVSEEGIQPDTLLPEWGFELVDWHTDHQGILTEWCRRSDPYSDGYEDEYCRFYIPSKHLSAIDDTVLEWLREIHKKEQEFWRFRSEQDLRNLAENLGYDLVKKVEEK